MYGPEILDFFDILGPFSLEATAESWAQDGCRRDRFPRYTYIRDSTWCSCDVTDVTSRTGESSVAALYSVILKGVPLTSRKWRRNRRQRHPPQRRIPYSGRCSRHVTDITFNRATGPSATTLYPSFYLLFLWPTGNHVLADDSCAFLLQVCCTVGNAYDTLGSERDPCVYNSEPHQTGRTWLRNWNYTNKVWPIQPLPLHVILNIFFRDFLSRATPGTPASDV